MGDNNKKIDHSCCTSQQNNRM